MCTCFVTYCFAEAGKLQEHLVSYGILQRAEEQHPEALLQFDTTAFENLWLKYCVQWVGRDANKILCSCWHFLWNSHCPHAYGIEIFLGRRPELPERLLDASLAQTVETLCMRSDDEEMQSHPQKRIRTT